jgi:Ca2+/Na+ antiporter
MRRPVDCEESMLKSWMRDAALAIQARTGFTSTLLVWIGLALLAGVTSFAYFTVAGYEWLAIQLGAIYGGLVGAGFFMFVAIFAALLAAATRKRAKQRAMLERAAHRPTTPWLLEPRLLNVAMQAGRTLGWQRIVTAALVGLLLGQWAWSARERSAEEKADKSQRSS